MRKHVYSTTVEVEVDVDISTEDLPNEDLIELCKERGIMAGAAEENQNDITEMFYAFRLGRNERAVELARKIAQDYTGRIL